MSSCAGAYIKVVALEQLWCHDSGHDSLEAVGLLDASLWRTERIDGVAVIWLHSIQLVLDGPVLLEVALADVTPLLTVDHLVGG